MNWKKKKTDWKKKKTDWKTNDDELVEFETKKCKNFES